MTIRYLRQRNHYTCGPIAIINTIKWLGEYATYKFLPAMNILCRCKYGTSIKKLDYALKTIGINKKRKARQTIKNIDRHLNADGAIIFMIWPGTKDGHYSLCIGKRKEKYVFVNYHSHETLSIITKIELADIIAECNIRKGICGWFIFNILYIPGILLFIFCSFLLCSVIIQKY